MSEIKTISEHKCFGGVQGFYSHKSEACNGEMRFGIFVPPAAKNEPLPALTYLAGLTCTEETFVIKAGAQRMAAELGLMLITPDTSPRNQNIEGEDDDWDFGTGAGFYLDATQEPWAKAYNMQTYVVEELRHIVAKNFPADLSRHGIFGHSMGGHGALTLHLKNPKIYKSASAFAPLCAPMSGPWGQNALRRYLGTDKKNWQNHDSSWLVKNQPSSAHLLIDQGLEDQFLKAELFPHLLDEAAKSSSQKLTLRFQEGYDHSYYFIQTFMEDHLRHHAEALNN